MNKNTDKYGGLPYLPVEGKTYSLFGDSTNTSDYYRLIGRLADEITARFDPGELLAALNKIAPRQRSVQKLASAADDSSPVAYFINHLAGELKPYTKNTAAHLRELPLLKRYRDRRLGTTEEQYHLYMLEIELTNRRNRDAFLAADRKISLQPYCLQDFSVKCKALKSGPGHRCRSCSKLCRQNHLSRLLSENNVEPYIWSGTGLPQLVRETVKSGRTLGVVGIACVPELAAGMRMMGKYGLPVVGLPLNANRCIRWYGEFHPNSVDMQQLERLVQCC